MPPTVFLVSFDAPDHDPVMQGTEFHWIVPYLVPAAEGWSALPPVQPAQFGETSDGTPAPGVLTN